MSETTNNTTEVQGEPVTPESSLPQKTGLTAEQKMEQIENAESNAPAEKEKVNDDDILNPVEYVITLGERKYKLLPLKLKEMRLLTKLSKVKIGVNFDDEQLDLIVDCISALIHEPDKNFIEENMDTPLLTELFVNIQKMNYVGVPTSQKGDTRKTKN